MSIGNNPTWQQLSTICVAYNDTDEVFDQEDVRRERQNEFPRLQRLIQARLDRITSQGRFEGWLALYQPALPGVQRVEPVIDREQAAPHRDHCEELLVPAMNFANDKLGLGIDWEEALSRKLAYKIGHPKSWDKLQVGTVLQALLQYQREYLVAVIPDWYIQHGGDLRSHKGLTIGQMFQVGRTAPEAADDWLGPNWEGLPDKRHNLGIDPEFE